MRDIDQVRRDNMRQLEVEAGGVAEAAAKAEMSPSQWGNLREGAKDSKTGKRRGMRKETARRIELAFKKAVGWLDSEHLHEDNPMFMRGGDATGQPYEVLSLPPSSHEASDVVISQFDTGGAMGHGVVLQEQPGIIKEWRVSDEWLRMNVHRVTSPKNLAIVTGFGDSMRGMFNPGDPLLVDTGVKSVDYDAIYFFRVSEEGFIKRLQRIPGEGLLAISENKAYRDWTIKPDMDFEVFGRVVKVWKGEEF